MLLELLIGLLAIWAGMFFFGLLTCGIQYLLWKNKGFLFMNFTCLFWRWDKDFYDPDEPGRIRCSFTRLNQFFPTLLMMSKTYPMEKSRRNARISAVIYFILSLLLLGGGGVIALFAPDTPWLLFVRYALGGGFAYFLTMALYSHKSGSKPAGLVQKICEIREVMIRNDADDLPQIPFAYPEYARATLTDKVNYLGIFYRYAEVRNDLMAMAEAANAYSKLGTMTLTETGHFRVDTALFAYYSFRERKPELAKKYYEHSKKSIDRDMDSNGRRKLAYYAFYILGDRELAGTYLEQGLRALDVDDPRLSDIERDLETRMLRYLESQLAK